nr:glycoside hydrolase family 5 protein [Ruminococcus sp.]
GFGNAAADKTSSAENAASADENGSRAENSAPSDEQTDGADEKKEVNMEIRDISSTELLKEIRIGWNLGNTLDATGDKTLGAETHWQPTTTSTYMMQLLKESGFDIVRIPVSWGEHMAESGDYKVDPKWMARVHEIVDYGIDNGLYVILNTHHENWYLPTEDDKAQDLEQLKALWQQIAEEFKGYDEHLIFEGTNEPRLRDTPLEWTGGSPGSREIVGEYAKTFYETVRASGGNNSKRHLMVTGYAAASGRESLEDIWLPDNGDDKVIVSVHAYLPYNFALNVNGTDKWSAEKDTGEIDTLLKNLNELFISKGVPVMIGEFGVLNKDNLDDRIACTEYYISEARKLGIPMLWWDNNAFHGNGENFGLMDRSMPPVWKTQKLVDAMINAAKQ